MKRNCDGLTFKEWRREVDRLVQAEYFIGLDDIADLPTWDSWDSGETPQSFIQDFVRPEVEPYM